MLLGLSLLYVGVVLILNGIWLLGRIADREIVVINLCVAGISTLVAMHIAFFAEGIADIRAAAMTLLFAITYLWVGHNRLSGCDGRGLGWFSLVVAITVVPVALHGYATADGVIGMWLASCWSAWAVLWFTYFLMLAMDKPIQRFTALLTLAVGVTTGWLPGMVLLFAG